MRILGAVYMTDYGKNQSFFVKCYQQHHHGKNPQYVKKKKKK